MFKSPSMLGLQKIMVSSAYWRWEIWSSPLLTSIPSHRFISVPLEITRLRHSTTRSKRKGDKGSPCLRPRFNLNGGVGDPLRRMDAEAEEIHEMIHFLQVAGKPIFPYFCMSSMVWSSKKTTSLLLIIFLSARSITYKRTHLWDIQAKHIVLSCYQALISHPSECERRLYIKTPLNFCSLLFFHIIFGTSPSSGTERERFE